MDDARARGWLGRKIAWGLRPDEWDQWADLGIDTVVDRLIDPDDHGIARRSDPFADLIPDNPAEQVRNLGRGVPSWMRHVVESPRPLESFMEFFWSDWFAVSARSVRPTWLMYDHMNLLGRHALGNFRDLLHDVSIDAAMLGFLDGVLNEAGNPNENFGRELLELYSVGVGNFTEDDVRAASIALTGWTYRRRDPVPRFVPFRHDDTPQVLLGTEGVHDLDSVIDTVVSHPATAVRVVDQLGAAILGPDHRADLATIVDSFATSLELRPVVRSLIELGIDGAATPSVMEPVPWLTMAVRFTGLSGRLEGLRTFFRSSGQAPLLPPNVGGFPEPEAYLSTSATIARFNAAAELAEQAQGLARAISRDVDRLAQALGLADGWTTSTREAIRSLDPGADRITAALASPDLLVV